MTSIDPGPLRRHVFFIAGFDPKRPRYYHALYRSQARRQAQISGLALEVDRTIARPAAHSSAWTIRAETPARPVHTVYEVLQWDDIVRAHWPDAAWRVLFDGVRTVAYGLRDGAVQRMYRLFRPPVYATFFPLAVMLLCSLGGAALGAGAALAVGRVAGVPAWLPPVAGVATAALLIGQSLAAVHRIQITWLLRLVRFTHLQATDRVAGLDERLTAFARRIAAVAAAPRASASATAADEILIVGHSVGATLAVSIVARLLDLSAGATGPLAGAQRDDPPIALLSLGHCIPLLSSLGAAAAIRRDLQRVAASGIDWLDLSAPIDWAAFPGVDPVTAAGLPAPPPGWHPRLLSPRFHQLFGAAGYSRLKRNRFNVHLQYLRSSERPGAYDYFAITAGAATLRQRFAETTAEASQ